MSAYFAMGGYGAYIWPSYALALLLLVGVFVLAARRLAAAQDGLAEIENEAGEGADAET